MGIYRTPAKLAAAQRKRTHLVGKKIEEVTRELAKEGTNDLRDANSGTLSEKQVRRGGGLYARYPRNRMQLNAAKRLHGSGLVTRQGRQVSRTGAVRVLPTNRWTGSIQRGIFMAKAGRNGWDVGSNARHAKYLFAPKGTKYMKPREVMGERTKHGKDGLLRLRHRARVQGYLNAVRDYQRRAVP